MNIKDETIPKNIAVDNDIPIENLVPTKIAYFLAYLTLFLSSLTGGFIGYGCARIFVPNASLMIEIIFALVSAIAICWSMSVVVTIGLKASVEFKSRKKLFPNSKRPSRLIR